MNNVDAKLIRATLASHGFALTAKEVRWVGGGEEGGGENKARETHRLFEERESQKEGGDRKKRRTFSVCV
jgi:hypothetical protein